MSDTDLFQQLEKTLGTQYSIERELGGGGMSRVFLATELALGRKVVIKVLPPALAASVNIERFRREIQLSAQLQHPLIVPVLASGVMEGLPYYTMPFIEGESLRARLSRDRELPLGDAVRILRDMVSALSYAHEKGVVHRDIKPDNVMLTRHHAVVTDFGVAKALSAATNPGNSLTSMGVALGTPAYMSPEQATADPNTDHRADIYAVGATAYEMITGRQLFSGRSPQAMLAAQAVEIPEPIEKHRPTVSPVLATLVMRTLEKHAADRPQSADELLHVLDALATPSGGMTPTMSTPAAAARGKPKWLTIGVPAAALLALGVFAAAKLLAKPPVLEADKVIVVPFQNKSGDSKLDQLSTLATDWVTRGIVETGVVDIGQFTPEKDASGKVKESAFEVPNLVKAARGQDAGRIVMGSFYSRGDSVQLQAQVIDANDGKIIGSIPAVTGALSDPMPAINEVRARVMGALAQMSGVERTGLSSIDAPPSYEAFKEFMRGQEAFDRLAFREALSFYKRAHQLDTGYYAPLVRMVYVYTNMGNLTAADSLGRMLNERRERLSDYEGYYLDRGMAWTRGDYPAAYVAAKQIARIAPKSSSAAYIAARSAIPVNRLHEAANAFAAMDIEKSHSSGYYSDYAATLHMLGDYEKSLDVITRGKKMFPDRVELLAREVQALSALHRPAEVKQLVELSMTRPGNPSGVMLSAARELAAHGHPAESKEVALDALEWTTTHQVVDNVSNVGGTQVGQGIDTTMTRQTARGALMILAGQVREANELGRKVLAVRSECIQCRSLIGQSAAILGDTASARQQVEALLQMKMPYLQGQPIYAAALIESRLGNKARAVRLLREAISKGVAYQSFNDAEPAFLSLRGYGPFEVLLKPAD